MRILSKVFFWLGLVVVVASILYCIFGGVMSIYAPYVTQAANLDNALYRALLDAVGLLLGGFFMGLGVGMIRRKKTEKEKGKDHAHAPAAHAADD